MLGVTLNCRDMESLKNEYKINFFNLGNVWIELSYFTYLPVYMDTIDIRPHKMFHQLQDV